VQKARPPPTGLIRLRRKIIFNFSRRAPDGKEKERERAREVRSKHGGVAECAALPCKNFLIRFEQLRGLLFFCFWRKISGKSQWLIPRPGHMAKNSSFIKSFYRSRFETRFKTRFNSADCFHLIAFIVSLERSVLHISFLKTFLKLVLLFCLDNLLLIINLIFYLSLFDDRRNRYLCLSNLFMMVTSTNIEYRRGLRVTLKCVGPVTIHFI